jgi:hypothetical protein
MDNIRLPELLPIYVRFKQQQIRITSDLVDISIELTIECGKQLSAAVRALAFHLDRQSLVP